MKMDLTLCSHVDDDLKNYNNIFDEIDVKTEYDKIDFTLVCKLDMQNDCDTEMTFHFFIFNETSGKKAGLYLMEGQYSREEKEILDEFKAEFIQVQLSGVGNYAVEVVRNDDMKETTQNDGPNIYKTGQVVGRIKFSVNIIS